MYNINNRRKFVGRIQNYLNVEISGAWDKRTYEALIEFKRMNLLSDNCTVDYQTFCALKRSYLKRIGSLSSLKLGDYSIDALQLNAMLSFIILHLRLDIPHPKGMLYSRITEQAIDVVSGHFHNVKSREELLWLLEYTYSVLSTIK